MVLIAHLQPWFTGKSPVRLLDIGCGTAVEAEPLLASGLITEFVGVDLDETAISLVQSRLPQATFLCADAAALDDSHHYDVILIRRPDLLARPAGWQQVFA
ncbi:MAG: class I SAM-dependent methyltransferase [Proteobacteria bacterium]|nr:class I SAM-dependent methyltransferase [Pseudomonadota bacterium]